LRIGNAVNASVIRAQTRCEGIKRNRVNFELKINFHCIFKLNFIFIVLLDHGYEVSTARGRLEGALQVLIDRTESETSDESDVDVTDVLQEGRRYNNPLSLHHVINSPVLKLTFQSKL
jgi:hypothetical protein